MSRHSPVNCIPGTDVPFGVVEQYKKLTREEQQEIDKQVERQLSREEFKLRALAEADLIGKKIADEIKDVLRKYGASLAEWNHNLYVVPPGFSVYSVWNHPSGVHLDPPDTGLKCEEINCNYRIIKPFPDA